MLNDLLSGPFGLGGVRIFQNPNVLEKTEEPRRAHKRLPWMARRVYHDRIQKKWIKRFGYVMKPAIWQTPHGLFVHPALMPQIRAALAR